MDDSAPPGAPPIVSHETMQQHVVPQGESTFSVKCQAGGRGFSKILEIQHKTNESFNIFYTRVKQAINEDVQLSGVHRKIQIGENPDIYWKMAVRHKKHDFVKVTSMNWSDCLRTAWGNLVSAARRKKEVTLLVYFDFY